VARPRKKLAADQSDTVGKRVVLDRELWHAIDVLARDRMQDFQELAEEAFRDVLKKHGRTDDIREALRLSARQGAQKPARSKGRK
jgi:hypothetical protein